MFIDNKYTKIYFSIIENAKKESRNKRDDYFESHHIIPKSLGGEDDSDNLVLLTAKEHFLCHLLLMKMTEGDAKMKMCHAIWMMCYSSPLLICSRTYEMVKRHRSESMKGVHVPGRWRSTPLTAEHKAKISRALTGRKFSPEHKAKLKIRNGTPQMKAIATKNLQKATEGNIGKKRPEHSAFMREFMATRDDLTIYHFIHELGTNFKGTRKQLIEKFPEHRIDNGMLGVTIRGGQKSHRGWRLG